MNTIAEIEQYIETVKIDKSVNTLISYNNAISKLFTFLNVQTFEDVKKIKSTDIRAHQNNMKKNGLKEQSVNANIRPLRAMFNWLVENELMDVSPIDKVKDLKEPKHVATFLTEEEQDKLIVACDDVTEKLIIALILSTGMRREEFCTLKLNDYNGTHILIHGKGNKERKLALQSSVIELLNKYIEYRNEKYGNVTDALIVSNKRCHFTGGTIYKKVKLILEKAGIDEDRIKDIHPHTLRHSFVANMLESGADIFTCQTALGHANLNTTMRYSHLHSSTLDRAMQNQKSVL